MIAAEVTQSVFIVIVVAVAATIVALGMSWMLGRKRNEPAVMIAKAKIIEDAELGRATLAHKVRMADIEYERAQDLRQSDASRRALEDERLKLENRRLELEVENPKPPAPPVEDAKEGGDDE